MGPRGAQQARAARRGRAGVRWAQQARAAWRGARGHGRGLGVPVRRLGVLVGSIGPVRVFGASGSVLT